MVAARAHSGAATNTWLAWAGAASLAAACSGKPRTDEATPAAAVRSEAGASDAASPLDAAPATGAAVSGAGDLQIRVEWRDVPVVARTSPGRTPCHTPRTPSVSPSTTWGIPDVLVIVDGATGTPGEARITFADCGLSPRIAIGSTLAITSAADRPAQLTLRNRGPLAALVAGEPRAVLLPIAGHTATTALDAGAIYALETAGADPETAFVAAIPGAHITDASGQLTVRGLAAGPHAVTAWLPPRAGQPARIGRGTATVTSSELAELTVTLAP